MESALSQLPKLSHELAADWRNRNRDGSGPLLSRERPLRRRELFVKARNVMTDQNSHNGHEPAGAAYEGTWPGIDSRFRLIIVASLRSKQLVQGSKPRIEVNKARRRHTSIALEEVKRGLVAFTNGNPAPKDQISKVQGRA